MSDFREKAGGEQRTPEEIFQRGVDSLREMYENGSASLEGRDELLLNAELATMMLTLEADGKIVMSEGLKEKATKDLDALLASIQVRDAEKVGDTILSVLSAMRQMNSSK